MNESDMETAIWILTFAVIVLLWLYFKKKPAVGTTPPLSPGTGGSVSVSVANPNNIVPGRCNCG